MTLTLHNLKSAAGSTKRRKRVGRGNASGSGTYSSRGLKGQRSRSGGKGGLKLRGLKQTLRAKPKLGGFRSPYPKMINVTLTQLENTFKTGDVVDTEKLKSFKLIKTAKPGVKILGSGKITKALTVITDGFSETAKQAIIKAGGKAEVRKVKTKPSKRSKKNSKK